MSYVVATPETMTAAAADLATIGSTLDAAHTAAAVSTVAVLPAAADEVSVSIAHLFSQHAQDYQALAVKAATFQEQFVHHLSASAGSYASAEAANGALLRPSAASAGSIGSAIGAFWAQLFASTIVASEQLDNFALAITPTPYLWWLGALLQEVVNTYDVALLVTFLGSDFLFSVLGLPIPFPFTFNP